MPPASHLQYDKIASTFGGICTKFVNDHRRLRRYRVYGSNNIYQVLAELRVGIANGGLHITFENSLYIAVEVQGNVIYVFVTETDADTLLVTISTNPNIVP